MRFLRTALQQSGSRGQRSCRRSKVRVYSRRYRSPCFGRDDGIATFTPNAVTLHNDRPRQGMAGWVAFMGSFACGTRSPGTKHLHPQPGLNGRNIRRRGVALARAGQARGLDRVSGPRFWVGCLRIQRSAGATPTRRPCGVRKQPPFVAPEVRLQYARAQRYGRFGRTRHAQLVQEPLEQRSTATSRIRSDRVGITASCSRWDLSGEKAEGSGNALPKTRHAYYSRGLGLQGERIRSHDARIAYVPMCMPHTKQGTQGGTRIKARVKAVCLRRGRRMAERGVRRGYSMRWRCSPVVAAITSIQANRTVSKCANYNTIGC